MRKDTVAAAETAAQGQNDLVIQAFIAGGYTPTDPVVLARFQSEIEAYQERQRSAKTKAPKDALPPAPASPIKAVAVPVNKRKRVLEPPSSAASALTETVERVRSAALAGVGHVMVVEPKGVPLEEALVKAVAAAHAVPVAALYGRARTNDVVDARGECFYLLRKELRYEFSRIGRMFGRDHSTVHHGVKKYCRRHGLPMP